LVDSWTRRTPEGTPKIISWLDARPTDRFRGENDSIDAVAGHIPGGVSAPALVNVDIGGRFLPAAELATRLRGLGATNVKALAHTAVQESRRRTWLSP